MFDALAYLASPSSSWKHTLVGWTGEVNQALAHDASGQNANETGVNAVISSGASSPTSQYVHANSDQASKSYEVQIPLEHRRSLQVQIERTCGGRVVPVWLADQNYTHDTLTLRDQHGWRQYGEHEILPIFYHEQKETIGSPMSKRAWEDHEKMNAAFADTIASVYQSGDLVIVHDYHLLLLPKLLRQRFPDMYIGFFLQTPFPDYKYFRFLPKRKELLEGILGANTIGFQTEEYSHHFAACCTEILGLGASSTAVDHFGAIVDLEVFPTGIDVAVTLQLAFESCAISDKVTSLRETHKGKKVILGCDRHDCILGAVQKLQAFELFLERHPEWQGKVVLFQITSSASKNNEIEDKISDLVARINGTFGTVSYTPVQYYPQVVGKDKYLALLRAADLGLITSSRDGMSTTALEYVLCQRDSHGPLMISELSGTAASLVDAIRVNPWDLNGVAKAINECLTLPEAERIISHTSLYDRVTGNSVQAWIDSFFNRLINNLAPVHENKYTPHLDRAKLVAQYRNSSRRLFMFDYDGTLTPIVGNPNAAIPSDKVIQTLTSLASDSRNAVWIISGRDQEFLGEYMGHISALGLSAEHGSFIRMPHTTDWEELAESYDMSWQDKVMEVFEKYTEQTIGSAIERKKIALTWHYRRADLEWGASQAQKCRRDLEAEVTDAWDVEGDDWEGKSRSETKVCEQG